MTEMVVLQCNGFDIKRKRRCTYVFGKTCGFEGKCPKCHTLMSYFHQRIEVLPARVR